MLLQRETFVQLHLQFGRVRLAILITRLLGIEEFDFPAIRPGDARGRQFIQPAELFLGQGLENASRNGVACASLASVKPSNARARQAVIAASSKGGNSNSGIAATPGSPG